MNKQWKTSEVFEGPGAFHIQFDEDSITVTGATKLPPTNARENYAIISDPGYYLIAGREEGDVRIIKVANQEL